MINILSAVLENKRYRFLIGYIFTLFIFLASWYWVIQPTYYRFSPRSWYFTWFEEQVVDAKVGEVLTFKSDREVLVNFPITYLDTVVCDEGKLVSASSYNANPKLVKRAVDFSTYNQVFSIDDYIPKMPYNNCILSSRVCMNLPYRIDRCQEIETKPFNIKE